MQDLSAFWNWFVIIITVSRHIIIYILYHTNINQAHTCALTIRCHSYK